MRPGYPAWIIERLHDDAQLPKRATQGSAGYDVHAYLNNVTVAYTFPDAEGGDFERLRSQTPGAEKAYRIAPGETAAIPLGFKATLPAGYEAQVRPRSGLAFKSGLLIANSPGTIDADYPDEWKVLLFNPTPNAVTITHGDRVAQIVLHRFETLNIVEGAVGVTTDRAGGFGSTGK